MLGSVSDTLYLADSSLANVASIRRCNSKSERPECGLDDNAGKNGALNIGNRALGRFSKPLFEAGPYRHGPKRRASSTLTANL